MDNNFFKSLIALNFIAFLIVGCMSPNLDGDSSIDDSVSIVVADQIVETVLPTMLNFTKELKVVGSVLPLQEVDILPLESGQISEILVDIGDYVLRDQILVELDNPLITREVEALRVEAEAAGNTLSRLKQAVKSAPGLVAASELDEAEAASARATVALEAGLDRMRFLSVRAPFDGIVSARNVHPGALVENGLTAPGSTPMLSIVSCKEIRILLPYPERDMRFIYEGGDVELNFPDLDKSINTTVSRVAATIDAESRTVDVLIDLKSNDCSIKPGIYVEGSLLGISRDSILSIPARVRFVKNGLPFASIVLDGIVTTIPLTIHAEDMTHIGFSADYVDGSTEFIITGRNLVSEGQTVTTQLLK